MRFRTEWHRALTTGPWWVGTEQVATGAAAKVQTREAGGLTPRVATEGAEVV